jgi:hypothetical protein
VRVKSFVNDKGPPIETGGAAFSSVAQTLKHGTFDVGPAAEEVRHLQGVLKVQ